MIESKNKWKKFIVFDLFGVIIDSHSKIKYNVSDARIDIVNYNKIDLGTLIEFFYGNRFGVTSRKKVLRNC